MDKFLQPCAAIVSLSLLLLCLLDLDPVTAASLRVRPRYDSIFSFGDSFADTGNNPVVFDWYSVFDPITRPPYGSTFFGRPTGRNCDGRLVIDFLAQSLGLPLVPPFLADKNTSFRGGANFAVGGATAMDASFFYPPGTGDGGTYPWNTSLGVQLQWFESLKPSLCSTTQECREVFSRSLFFVGEFGFNDYSILLGGRSVQQVRSFVPNVVATISMATERLIKHGATSLVVPGMLPAGCAPPILVMFADDAADPAEYDSRTGCLSEINELSTHHNSLLRQALHDLRTKHPDAEIIYADFFSPVMEMVETPAKFGFEEDVLTICCGAPGKNKYHFSLEVWCGDPGATECEDPSARLFWDGVHMTEAAYRYIAADWLTTIESSAASASSQ